MGALQRDNGPGPTFERSDASPLAVTDRCETFRPLPFCLTFLASAPE